MFASSADSPGLLDSCDKHSFDCHFLFPLVGLICIVFPALPSCVCSLRVIQLSEDHSSRCLYSVISLLYTAVSVKKQNLGVCSIPRFYFFVQSAVSVKKTQNLGVCYIPRFFFFVQNTVSMTE